MTFGIDWALKMDDLKALKVPVSSHKKQISIESKIERIVEDDDRGDLEWRTKLEPVVSVTIRRGSEVMMEESKPPSTSIQDPSVSISNTDRDESS